MEHAFYNPDVFLYKIIKRQKTFCIEDKIGSTALGQET